MLSNKIVNIPAAVKRIKGVKQNKPSVQPSSQVMFKGHKMPNRFTKLSSSRVTSSLVSNYAITEQDSTWFEYFVNNHAIIVYLVWKLYEQPYKSVCGLETHN